VSGSSTVTISVKDLRILADREPLEDAEFVGVRRAKGIDVVILATREPDRIDHERIPALVMADGFAEPGWLHMFRMFVGEIDAACEMIALPYHPDLLRRLEEIQEARIAVLGGTNSAAVVNEVPSNI
jgi:hypothetical protein